MNTAARMESSSLRNRIHVSEKTAELLTVGGKSSWLKKREVKINPKGKGEMQTYWVEPVSSRATGEEVKPPEAAAKTNIVAPEEANSVIGTGRIIL